MSARSPIALAMLSSLVNEKRKQSDVRYRDERQMHDRSLSLFSGRGIICLGAEPRRSQSKEPQD